MKTPITYYGGKQTMLKHILPLIPKHDLFTEVFCGGCAVYFAKEPVKVEVINDINMHITNFYGFAKTAYKDLKEKIDETLHSRDVHAHALYMLSKPQFFTPVQRAWAVWTLSKISFASKQDGAFGYDFSGSTTKKLHNAKDAFTEILCARLDNTTIENKNALDVLKRYDKPFSFHFIDPPYINTNCGHYEGVWSENNLIELLDLLPKLQGKWMLTMFPNKMIKLYSDKYGWNIHEITRKISASKIKRREQTEWIITSY